MKSTVLDAPDILAVPLERMKSYARISGDYDDHLLTGLIKTATTWVEEETGKDLLTKTRKVSHHNNVLTLPYAPIQKILEVKSGRRIVSSENYQLNHTLNTLTIPVHQAGKSNSVTYQSGFGHDPKDIPETLAQAVMSTVLYIYENRYELSPKQSVYANAKPWIHYHRSYQMI